MKTVEQLKAEYEAAYREEAAVIARRDQAAWMPAWRKAYAAKRALNAALATKPTDEKEQGT